MRVFLIKLNGWPDNYGERVGPLSEAVDELVVIRQATGDGPSPAFDNVTEYRLPPRRSSYIPVFLHPVVFPVYAIQALVLMVFLIGTSRGPDVVHAIDYVVGGLVGAVLCRASDIPFVVSVRGLQGPRYRDMIEEGGSVIGRLNYRVVTGVPHFVFRQADHVITKSEYQQEFVRETFGVSPGFTTVPTGVDFERFDPSAVDAGDVLVELTGNDELCAKINLVFLGKLIPAKGPDVLLELLSATEADLPAAVHVTLIGEFADERFERRMNRLRADVSGRVDIYPNRIPFDLVPRVIADADAIVLLSEPAQEGIPRVLQESCVMETPIIAADVVGVAEAFRGHDGCYLIERDSPEAFETAVRSLVFNQPRMDREEFRETLDMRSNYRRYADVYNSLV